jgi:PST family polysaccharide transporter
LIGPVYLVTARTGRLAAWGAASTAAVVVAFIVGVQWGALGVAVAYAITSILLVYPALALSLPLISTSVSTVARFASPIVVFSFAAGAVAYLLGASLSGRMGDALILVVQLGSGVAVFVALMAVGRRGDLRDVAELLGLSPRTRAARA